MSDSILALGPVVVRKDWTMTRLKMRISDLTKANIERPILQRRTISIELRSSEIAADIHTIQIGSNLLWWPYNAH